jgi:hypothetical protein
LIESLNLHQDCSVLSDLLHRFFSNRLARRAAAVLLTRRARRLLVDWDHQDSVRTQARILRGLVHRARSTAFGRDHDFQRIRTAEDFRRLVPLQECPNLSRDTSTSHSGNGMRVALTALAFADAVRGSNGSGVVVNLENDDLGERLNADLPFCMRQLIRFRGEPEESLEDAQQLQAVWTPAGAIALEDPRDELLRLLTDHGSYFEFIPLEQIERPRPARLTLGEIETGALYAVAVTSETGPWARLTDVTVAFEKRDPPLLTRVFVPSFAVPSTLQAPHRRIADTRAVRPEIVAHTPWTAPVDLG